VKTPSAVDRRKYPRVRTDAIVSISRIEANETLAHSVDLSMGGIRFQCVGVELEAGETVRVALTLGASTVNVVGELARVTELDAFTQEVALAFTQVDPETLAALRDALPESQEFDPRDQ
jgi:hypothetical protein